MSKSLFEIEKNYKDKSLIIVKYSEVNRVAVGEVFIDFNRFDLLYKSIGIRGGKLREPREEDLFHFDYGHDIKFIYDEIKDFYEEVGDGEITFYEIEENLGVPLLKYLKLKISFLSIEVLNNYYKCELLLYSDRLFSLTIEELNSLYSVIDKEFHIGNMFKVSKKSLENFKSNVSKVMEFIYYAEYLYVDLNYSYGIIDDFFSYAKRYGLLIDYRNFLKCIEVIRHNSDLYQLVEFMKIIEVNNKENRMMMYVDNYIKRCRKEVSERRDYSSNILTDIINEIELKEESIDDKSRIHMRINDLVELFEEGYIAEFSELFLDLRDVYSLEDYNILLEGVRTKLN